MRDVVDGSKRFPGIDKRIASGNNAGVRTRQKTSVPNWIVWLLVILGVALTVVVAGQMRVAPSFLNTSETIFDTAHLRVEALIFAAILFLASDALWRGRQDPRPRRWEALARRARLAIAFAIFAVHMTVLLLGGYRP